MLSGITRGRVVLILLVVYISIDETEEHEESKTCISIPDSEQERSLVAMDNPILK